MTNVQKEKTSLGSKSLNRQSLTQFKKGDKPWNNGLKGFMSGEQNKMWKGDRVGYGALHDWLRLHYGKASHCEFCGTSGNPRGRRWNIEWALRKGMSYERKIENYIMLCAKCHTKYDDKIPKGWNKGRKETRPEVLKRQSESHIGIKPNRVYYRRSHE